MTGPAEEPLHVKLSNDIVSPPFKSPPKSDAPPSPEASSYMPPTPPPNMTFDPLSTLADISLATRGLPPYTASPFLDPAAVQTNLARLIWPTLLKQRAEEISKAMADLNNRQRDFTPSNSPSPPPAHASPPRPQIAASPAGLNAFPMMRPVQSAPEDLRVIARKLDMSEEESNCSGSVDGSHDGQRKEGIFSCEECGKSYSTSSNLARHRQTHR